MAHNNFLITVQSQLPVKTIIARIEKFLQEKQINVFAKISHSDAASAVGLSMQDEEVIIFGNPKVGTALMIECPAIGIELPLKIAVWRMNDTSYIAYQDLDKLAESFGIKKSIDTINLLKQFMQNIVKVAVE